MRKPNHDGGSISPDMLPDGLGGLSANGGLSIRDWFAGMALQGLLQNGAYSPSQITVAAYSFADAMLAARTKGGEQ